MLPYTGMQDRYRSDTAPPHPQSDGKQWRQHNVVSNDFGRVSYTEAVEILKNSGRKFEYPVEWLSLIHI